MNRLTSLIFAKYPTPGTVKTRMVPPLTPEQAAALHEASLLAVCERVAGVDGLEANLVVAPDHRVDELHKIVGDRVGECWPQGDGSLGQRLSRAVNRALTGGADGVLLLGADSPTIPSSLLDRAVASLAGHDAVLGPCEDGGYYLLGLRGPWPVLFREIDWGSSRVARQTRDRAAEAGIDLCELPAWYDLDRFDDLARAAHDLARMEQGSQPATARLRCLIEAVLCEGT